MPEQPSGAPVSVEDQARQDVEATLEAGRASLERGVARGRVALFGAMTLVGAAVSSALSFTSLGEQVRGASSFARIGPLLVLAPARSIRLEYGGY